MGRKRIVFSDYTQFFWYNKAKETKNKKKNSVWILLICCFFCDLKHTNVFNEVAKPRFIVVMEPIHTQGFVRVNKQSDIQIVRIHEQYKRTKANILESEKRERGREIIKKTKAKITLKSKQSKLRLCTLRIVVR